jgi:hypothetical protein
MLPHAGRSCPPTLPPRPPGTPLLCAVRNVQAVLGQALAARLSPMRAVQSTPLIDPAGWAG